MKAVKLCLLCAICFLISVISSYASEESLTITTYYPSPYGSYRELRSQMMAIGTNYYSASYTCWPGGSCTYPIPAAASLIVEGNVGIGTTNPGTNKLQVNGKIQAIGGDICTDQGGGKCLSAAGGRNFELYYCYV